MKEESVENRRIRLRNYEAIAAGEKAAMQSVEARQGKINLDEYWKAYRKAYLEKIEELSFNPKKEREMKV